MCGISVIAAIMPQLFALHKDTVSQLVVTVTMTELACIVALLQKHTSLHLAVCARHRAFCFMLCKLDKFCPVVAGRLRQCIPM